MLVKSLIREFRLHVDDLEPEEDEDALLWSDEEVLSYLNEAINEFAQETEVLIDSSNALTQLVVTADDPLIPYDYRIIRFGRACYDLTSSQSLDIVSILNVQDSTYFNDYGLNMSTSAWMVQTGNPRVLLSDMETQQLRAYPIPVVDTTIAVTVRRLPLKQITQDDADGVAVSPEIPQRFHRKLLTYMKMLAYGKEDGETYDRVNMVKYAGMWERDLLDIKTRLERERGKRPRVVKYRDVGAPVVGGGNFNTRRY